MFFHEKNGKKRRETERKQIKEIRSQVKPFIIPKDKKKLYHFDSFPFFFVSNQEEKNLFSFLSLNLQLRRKKYTFFLFFSLYQYSLLFFPKPPTRPLGFVIICILPKVPQKSTPLKSETLLVLQWQFSR